MRMSLQQQTFLLLLAALAIVPFLQGNAFVIQPQASRYATRIFETIQAPSSMQASDIRKELESYGISTKSFLEKKDLVEALEKARAEGKTPQKNVTSSSSSSDVNGDRTSSSATTRQEKLEKELNNAKRLKVRELKKALEDMGISTKSFFEKTEFVKAYAEAMVDGPPKQKAGTRAARQPQSQEYDPSYRDVVMRKLDKRELSRGPVIDIRLGR